MKLTTMTENAIRSCAREYGAWNPITDEEWRRGPSRADVAKLTYRQVKDYYSIGKLGLRDMIAWLAEDGLSLRETEKVGPVLAVTKARIDDAISLLRRCGYTVVEPSAPTAQTK
jgi:hypothetical protein